jgi:hypothetical protein
MNYREQQRDFEKRAKARTVVYAGKKPMNIGRNAAKRARRAARAAMKGVPGGWKLYVVQSNIATREFFEETYA